LTIKFPNGCNPFPYPQYASAYLNGIGLLAQASHPPWKFHFFPDLHRTCFKLSERTPLL